MMEGYDVQEQSACCSNLNHLHDLNASEVYLEQFYDCGLVKKILEINRGCDVVEEDARLRS